MWVLRQDCSARLSMTRSTRCFFSCGVPAKAVSDRQYPHAVNTMCWNADAADESRTGGRAGQIVM